MPKPSQTILIVVRFDAATKNGGDYQMMRNFEGELSKSFKTEICYGVPSEAQLEAKAAVLSTNLDRPFEALHTMHACRAKSIPFILYTLHHPHEGIASYLRNGARGFKRRVAQLAAYDPQRYEQLLWLLRSAVVFGTSLRPLPQARLSTAQAELVTQADAVVCCGPGESMMLRKDIENPARVYFVPHPADAPGPVDIDYVPNRVVVAGRIEARKNQISALKIAQAMPDLNFVFVGGKVPSEAAYYAEFEKVLAQTPNAKHKATLPKEDFYPFLASAEVVLNPSFFEVTSLIDLYCVNNGLPLVTTIHTYLQAEGSFRQFNPADVSDGVNAIRLCFDDVRNGKREVWSVTDSRDRTMVEVLEDVL